MKEIVPKNSRYVPMVQGKYCCVPACISMIMYRHRIPLVPQELLGYHLGLTVKAKDRYLFWNARTGKRPVAGWGTQMQKAQYGGNKAFSKLKIPLKVSFVPVSSFDDVSFRKYLKQVENKDQDVLACFDYRVLSGQRKTTRGAHQGHMCVIDRADLELGKVRLVDPSPIQPKWRIVNIKELKKSMDWHHTNSGGFWKFEIL